MPVGTREREMCGRVSVGPWPGELLQPDVDAERTQFGDECPVVNIAAGRLVLSQVTKPSRCRQPQSSQSRVFVYPAQASGCSRSVTSNLVRPILQRCRDSLGDEPCHGLGGGERPSQLRVLVEVAVIEVTQCVAENVGSLADVDHDRFRAERLAPQRQLDDVGGTMQILSGAERRMRRLWAIIT